jgi:hypothetical protein
MENPSGLGKYRIRRGTTSGVYNTIVTDNLPITTTQFLDSFVQNGETYYYRLDTFDEVGNMAQSAERSTTISLPFTPAQPDTLPPTSQPSFVLDWTDNPGYGSGVTITGYQVWWATSTDGSYPASGSYSLATNGDVNTATTWTAPSSLTEATYYFLKVLSETSGGDLYSSPVVTRADTVDPLPAELATPLPTYEAETEEIIVSWSIETLPQYQTGGFPGQDLNGIDHWIIYKKVGTGSWYTLATVPYGAAAQDQRLTDTDVSDGTQYSYSIATVDGAGNSALCQYNKTTTLDVVGPGVAQVYLVQAASDQVMQGAEDLDITLHIRNPGATSVTLNTVDLYLFQGGDVVTSEYSYTPASPGSTLTAGETEIYVITVDVSPSATTGEIQIRGKTTYDTTKTYQGAVTGDAWTVLPNASLDIQTVYSSYTTVHPGEEDIPVRVTVNNPGTTPATLETLQLTFTRGGDDLSDKFLVEFVTSLPVSDFTGATDIDLLVTVSQSVTLGGVTVDATVTGTAAGVALSDTDGAVTPKTWAVATWPKPVIASIEADQDVYWAPPSDIIELTVICDKGGHTVSANFDNVQSGAGSTTASNPGGGLTYIISFTLTTPVGEGTYDVDVTATNASGSTVETIEITLGQAPDIQSVTQNPIASAVGAGQVVDIDCTITDNGGDDLVDAYLEYRVDGSSWIMRTMSYAGSGHWDVTIPGQGSGTYVEYRVVASDQQDNTETAYRDYTVEAAPPVPVITGTGIHAPGDPGDVYNETPGYGAPQDTPVAYSVTVDTQFVETPAFYYVLVSAFDPIRNSFIDINASVWMQAPVSVDITLQLTFDSSTIPSGTLITGKIFILTDLPANNGQTVGILEFSHLVE